MSALPAKMLKPGLGGGRNRLRVPERGIAPELNIGEHLFNPAVERNRRSPVEVTADFADIGPGNIGFAWALGDIDHVSPDQLDQMIDALGIAGAEVPDFADKAALGRTCKRFSDVGDIEKVPPLGAVADDRERLSGKLLLEEHPEHRPIGTRGAHPWPVGIENANRVGRQPVGPMPVEYRYLALVFAQRIRMFGSNPVVFSGGD